MPIDFDKFYITDDAEPAFEGYFKSTEDIVINMDKWNVNNKRILYITGHSGSGKTTRMNNISQIYPDVQMISLDWISCKCIRGQQFVPKNQWIHPLIIKYADTHIMNTGKSFTDETVVEENRKFITWLKEEMNKPEWIDKLFILEGTQIFLVFDAEYLCNEPFILNGTSMFTSMLRAEKRYYTGNRFNESSWNMKIFKAVKRFFTTFKRTKHYWTDQKKIDAIINELGTVTEGYSIVDDIEPAYESILKSTDDLVINLDKWKKGTNTNILFITGLSGSGKSTLGRQMAEKYGATLIECDWLDPEVSEYFENSDIDPVLKDKIRKIVKSGMRPELKWSLGHYLEDAVLKVIKICRADKNRLYVLEGIQMYENLSADWLKTQPLIIKGTSMVTSMRRRSIRESEDGKSHLFKEMKDHLNYYRNAERQLDALRKDLLKNGDLYNLGSLYVTDSKD